MTFKELVDRVSTWWRSATFYLLIVLALSTIFEAFTSEVYPSMETSQQLLAAGVLALLAVAVRE